MKYVVAVSGGVDSVVLLDMLARDSTHELIVAHFDHGIRPESDADARFVQALAEKYSLTYEYKREELGTKASEELARERRYMFLKSVAKKHSAKLVVAHHQDDVVETIAINIKRGTGWRGLAVMDNETIGRPLLNKTKAELYEYALVHGLEWVEDETNANDVYLRNRLRRKLHEQLGAKERAQLIKLWQAQCTIRNEVDKVAPELLDDKRQASRYFFTHCEEVVAIELLRAVLEKHAVSLTRPQRKRLLHAIKTMHSGTTFEAGNGVSVEFTKREFVVKLS